MKKITIYSLLGIALVIIGVCINQKCKNRIQEPEYVFTYAENQPEDYPTTLGAYEFAELVEERTDGRIQIIVYENGVLGDEKSVVSQMRSGGIDFSRVSLSTVTDDLPQLNVLQMPYLYVNSEHMWNVLEGEIGENFLNAFDAYDLVALSWYDAGARNFYSIHKPISCVGDMKGLCIRVQDSTLMKKMVESLGAEPVTSFYSEVYSFLEKDLVDGAENNWPSYEASSHYEVAKYYTVDEHTRVPEVQLCSQATWDKLSKEDQEIIQISARESAIYERELWIKREEESKKIVEEMGVVIIELSKEEKEKFRNAVTGVYEEFCGDYMDIIDQIAEASE